MAAYIPAMFVRRHDPLPAAAFLGTVSYLGLRQKGCSRTGAICGTLAIFLVVVSLLLVLAEPFVFIPIFWGPAAFQTWTHEQYAVL